MTPQEQARQAVIQALGALTLQNIEQQVQIAELQQRLRQPTQPSSDASASAEAE